MLEQFLAGVLLSLSLELPLGPINAMIIARSVRHSWIEGLKVGWGAWTADVILFLAVLLGLFPFLSSHLQALFIAGGIVLLLFGVDTMRSISSTPLLGKTEKIGDSFLAGVFIGLSNPFQIIWWTVVGMALFASSAWMVLGVLVGSGIFITVLPFVAGKTRHFFGTSLYRVVVIGSALLLFAFGLLFLQNGLSGLQNVSDLSKLWALETNAKVITYLLSGVLLGVSLFISPGPVFTTVIARSVKYNWLEGVKVSLGTLVADFLLVLAVFFGFFPLLSRYFSTLFIAGGVFLFILGVDLLKNRRAASLQEKEEKIGNSFVAGFFLGISNPFLLVFWLTVGLGLLAESVWIIIGMFATLVACETLLAVAASKMARFVKTNAYQALIIFLAFYLFALGLLFLYNGLTGDYGRGIYQFWNLIK